MAENITTPLVEHTDMTANERQALIKALCSSTEFYANQRDFHASLADAISDVALAIEEAGLGHDAVSLLKAALELATGKKVKLED